MLQAMPDDILVTHNLNLAFCMAFRLRPVLFRVPRLIFYHNVSGQLYHTFQSRQSKPFLLYYTETLSRKLSQGWPASIAKVLCFQHSGTLFVPCWSKEISLHLCAEVCSLTSTFLFFALFPSCKGSLLSSMRRNFSDADRTHRGSYYFNHDFVFTDNPPKRTCFFRKL